MASSGIIWGTRSQNTSYFRVCIHWNQNSQSIDNNTTHITAQVLVDTTSTGRDWNGTVSNFKFTVDGSTVSPANFTSNSVNSWTYTASSSPTGRAAKRIHNSRGRTIYHNDDGTGSLPLSASFSLPSGGYGPGNVSISGSGTLNTIPRGMMWVRASGTWRKGQAWVKVSGTWRKATRVWTRTSDTWRGSV